MADIPGNGPTTSVIRIGELMSGSLEVLGDRDWIRLSLNAGQEVRVDLAGIGFNPVSDTYLLFAMLTAISSTKMTMSTPRSIRRSPSVRRSAAFISWKWAPC